MTAPQIIILTVLTNIVCFAAYKVFESIQAAMEDARKREAAAARKLGEELGKDFVAYVLGTGRHARR
jgi:hypothetical protein